MKKVAKQAGKKVAATKKVATKKVVAKKSVSKTAARKAVGGNGVKPARKPKAADVSVLPIAEMPKNPAAD